MFETIRFKTDDAALAEIIFEIRNRVFVIEQHVSKEEEYDEFEEEAMHYLLRVDEKPAGTARWRFTQEGSHIKLERFAVLPEFRNKGAGSQLVKAVLEDVIPYGLPLYLHAQVPAMNLYARAGFKAVGELFYEAGIPHYKMVYQP